MAPSLKLLLTQGVLKALGIEYHTVPGDPNLQKKLKRLMTSLKDIHVSITFTFFLSFSLASFVFFPGGSEGKASACNVGDPGFIPGSGRSPGEGNGNPLQYSCLENPMDGEAW